MKCIKDALAYKHFVFVDCNKCTTDQLCFYGSICAIDNKVYQFRYKEECYCFELLTEAEITKLKVARKKLTTIQLNETIGIIIYDGNREITQYEYKIPAEISGNFIVE